MVNRALEIIFTPTGSTTNSETKLSDVSFSVSFLSTFADELNSYSYQRWVSLIIYIGDYD
jgi:hypothetical protein